MRLLRSHRLNGGLRPQTPGIYRFRARMVCHGGGWSRLLPFRLLSRRSGCVPALPYPPLRYSQSGPHQPRRAMIFHRTATTPLTFCLTRGVHPKTRSEPACVPSIEVALCSSSASRINALPGQSIYVFAGTNVKRLVRLRKGPL